jgi:hypothetical protein
VGSGYTVEGQKTGIEKYGGLQIEVIPSFNLGLAKWLKNETEAKNAIDDASLFLDERLTPAQLGLRDGDKILAYPSDFTYRREAVVSDMIGKRTASHDKVRVSVKVIPHFMKYTNSLLMATAGALLHFNGATEDCKGW